VKTLKTIVSIFTVLLMSTMVSFAIAPALDIPILPVFGGLTALSLIPMPSGVSFMALQKEIWITDVVGNLFKANPHLQYAMNADGFVLNGKVVHIPNAGNKPNVEKNRTKYPATITKRNDIDIYFVLDEYTSDPVKIDNAEKYELSYDLRNSLLGESKAAIAEMVGDWMLRNWAPSATACIKRTTGSTTVAAHYGTGVRKVITLEDIKGIQKLMNSWSIPQEGRFAQLDAEMYDQFTSLLNVTAYRDFSAAYDISRGIVGKVYGFEFLDPRASVLKYANDTTPAPSDPGSADNTTDNGAALFWQKDLVVRAMGENEMFSNENDPQHYGDIYSFLLRAGGRIKRNDSKGVVALVQKAG